MVPMHDRIILAIITTALVFCLVESATSYPPQYGGLMTMSYSTTNPSEANIFDTTQYLNNPSGNFMIATYHPRGGDTYIKNAVDGEAYYYFASAGSPTCVKGVDRSPVPSTLINISPFTYSGSGAVHGQLTDHYRYLSVYSFVNGSPRDMC